MSTFFADDSTETWFADPFGGVFLMEIKLIAGSSEENGRAGRGESKK